jgi:hypothetical protein
VVRVGEGRGAGVAVGGPAAALASGARERSTTGVETGERHR